METTSKAIVSRDAGECDAYFSSRAAVYALVAYIGELFPKTDEDELMAWSRLFVLALCGQNPQDRPIYTPEQIKQGAERLLVDWERSYPPKPSVIAKAISNHSKNRGARRDPEVVAVAARWGHYNGAINHAIQAIRMGKFSPACGDYWWTQHSAAMAELSQADRAAAGAAIQRNCDFYQETNTMREHSDYGRDEIAPGPDNLGGQNLL